MPNNPFRLTDRLTHFTVFLQYNLLKDYIKKNDFPWLHNLPNSLIKKKSSIYHNTPRVLWVLKILKCYFRIGRNMLLPEKKSLLCHITQLFQHPASTPSTLIFLLFISQGFHYNPPLLLSSKLLWEQVKAQAADGKEGGLLRAFDLKQTNRFSWLWDCGGHSQQAVYPLQSGPCSPSSSHPKYNTHSVRPQHGVEDPWITGSDGGEVE